MPIVWPQVSSGNCAACFLLYGYANFFRNRPQPLSHLIDHRLGNAYTARKLGLRPSGCSKEVFYGIHAQIIAKLVQDINSSASCTD